MPSPTPPEKVLAAAQNFAREKFGSQHRYAMVLHTDQRHPHVHMVVKAESEEGRRLHIDKEMLREWREDFARLMRAQGVAANATPRFVRGRSRGKTRDAIYRAQRRGDSTVIRQRVIDVAKHLGETGPFRDPAHKRLREFRKALIHGWLNVAQALDQQGEVALAGDVRHFARHMPAIRTDGEALAAAFARHVEASRGKSAEQERKKNIEQTR
jgi:type IV secretory pathway VirD2 relaxase